MEFGSKAEDLEWILNSGRNPIRDAALYVTPPFFFFSFFLYLKSNHLFFNNSLLFNTKPSLHALLSVLLYHNRKYRR